MVDTALLIAGALAAQQYFTMADADEAALRVLVDRLYQRVDWRWSQNGGAPERARDITLHPGALGSAVDVAYDRLRDRY